MLYMKETFDPGDLSWIANVQTQSTRFQVCQYDEPHRYDCLPLPFARFVYIRQGRVKFTCEGQLIMTGKEKDVLYIPKTSTYSSEWTSHSSYFVVDVWYSSSTEGTNWFEETFCKLFEDKSNVLGVSVDQIFESYEKADPFYWLECAATVTKFLCDISRMKNDVSLIEAGIYHAVMYLRHHFDKEITTAELAQMCSFSESQFRRLFKQHMHMSPTEYRNTLRVKRAEELINVHRMTAAQAAEKVGFSDVNYFYRLAKRLRESRQSQPQL